MIKQLLFIIFFLPITVLAQQTKTASTLTGTTAVKEDGKTVLYKKNNKVNFDDNLIQGELKNPNEFYFVHRPEEKFNDLLQRRKNFHKEMLRDAVMIR